MGSAGSNESALSFYLKVPRVGADPRVCPNSCLCCPCCFQIIRIKNNQHNWQLLFPIPVLLFSLFRSFLGKITANYT